MRRWARWLQRHPSAMLLFAQLGVIVIYPFLDGSTVGRAIIGVAQLIAVAAAVLAVRSSPSATWFAVLFGLPAMVFAVWESVSSEHWVVLVSAALHVPLYFYVSYAMIRYLFHDDVVTRDELFATGAAFTVVAWAFAYLYAATQVLWPGSFGPEVRPWFDLLFLSFTALASVGLGDFSPVLAHARSLVILEEIAGVFYVALVVSRLVGLAISRQRH